VSEQDLDYSILWSIPRARLYRLIESYKSESISGGGGGGGGGGGCQHV